MTLSVLPPNVPFSPYTRHGGLLFLSGMLGHEPGSRRLVSGGVGPETRQALKNITSLLAQEGLGLGHVRKAVVYLTDLDDWEAMNQVWCELFTAPYPARSAVAVQKLMLGACVEIEVIAADDR